MAARPDAARPRQHAQRGLPLLGRDGRPARGCAGGRTWSIGARVGIGCELRRRLAAPAARRCRTPAPAVRGVPPVRPAARGLEGRRPLAGRLEREGGRARSRERRRRPMARHRAADRRPRRHRDCANVPPGRDVGTRRAPPRVRGWSGPADAPGISGPGVPGDRDVLSVGHTVAGRRPTPDRARRRSNGHPALVHAGCSRRGTRRAPRPKPVRWFLAGPHRRRCARSAGRPSSSCGMPMGPRSRS